MTVPPDSTPPSACSAAPARATSPRPRWRRCSAAARPSRSRPRTTSCSSRRRCYAPPTRHAGAWCFRCRRPAPRDGVRPRPPARARRRCDRRRTPGSSARRIVEIARRHGANVVEDRGRAGASTCPTSGCWMHSTSNPNARLLAVVHAETSTGVQHPLRELGAAMRGRDALLHGRLRHLARWRGARLRRLGNRLRLLVHAEVLGRPPRDVSDRGLRACARADPLTRTPRSPTHSTCSCCEAYWVHRPPGLPPHRPDAPHLRAARGAAPGEPRGPRGSLAAPCRRRRVPAGRLQLHAVSSCSPSPTTNLRRSPPSVSLRA